jgi:hypothetical protein
MLSSELQVASIGIGVEDINVRGGEKVSVVGVVGVGIVMGP